MSLQHVFGTNTQLTGWGTALASVAAGGTTTSGAVSIAQPSIKLECDLNLDGAGTETADFYLIESTDGGTVFSTEETQNMKKLGSIEFNGTTLVKKILTIHDLPDDWKIYIKNNSAQGLGASSDIYYQSMTLNDV